MQRVQHVVQCAVPTHQQTTEEQDEERDGDEPMERALACCKAQDTRWCADELRSVRDAGQGSQSSVCCVFTLELMRTAHQLVAGNLRTIGSPVVGRADALSLTLSGTDSRRATETC